MNAEEKIERDPLEQLEETSKELDGKKDNSVKVVIDTLKDRGLYLFSDERSRAHVQIEIDGHLEIYPLDSSSFRAYIQGVYSQDKNKTVYRELMAQVLDTLRAQVSFLSKDRKIHTLHTRCAWYEKSLWYDLADEGWRAIRIHPSLLKGDGPGWEVVNKPPVLFRRFEHQKPQVEPIVGGDIKEIMSALNIKEDPSKELLFLSYLIVSLIPNIPRPILSVLGEQGSAKSTFAKIIKQLIDPSVAETFSLPRKTDDGVILKCENHYLLSFDNCSIVTDDISDFLSSVVTGTGSSKRKLFTDSGEVIYQFKRALVMNGIAQFASRPDLLDRMLIFELEPILDKGRLTEAELWSGIEAMRPSVLGALFTLLAKTMSSSDTPSWLPRLADYGTWAFRACKAMGYEEDSFREAFQANVALQVEAAIEGSLLGQEIMRHNIGSPDVWQGTASELYDKLIKEDFKLETSRSFPKSALTLGRELKRIAPALRKNSINVTFQRDEKSRKIIIDNQNDLKGEVKEESENVDLPDL